MTDINAILDAIAPVLESIVDSKIEKALNRKNSSTSVLAKYAGTDSNGKQWVVYDGTDVKAPISWSTIEATEGDRVSVTISNGRAVMDDNLSNPSAGVIGVEKAAMTAEEAKNDAVTAIQYSQQAYMAANDAQTSAESASAAAATAAIAADDAKTTADAVHGLAEQAQTDAIAAKTAADVAKEDADTAHTAADIAQSSADAATRHLSDVEQVVGTVNWIAEHGSYLLTSDPAPVAGKAYYTLSGGTYALTEDTTVDAHKQYYESDGEGGYVPVASPVVADIGSYYERSGMTVTRVDNPQASSMGSYFNAYINESVQNLVDTHVWVDSNGLNVSSENDETSGKTVTTGWRIGNVFEMLRDSVSWLKLWVENNVAKLRLGRSDQSHVVLDSDSLDIEDSTGVAVASFGEYSHIGKQRGSSHVRISGSAFAVGLYSDGGYGQTPTKNPDYLSDGALITSDRIRFKAGGYVAFDASGNGMVLKQANHLAASISLGEASFYKFVLGGAEKTASFGANGWQVGVDEESHMIGDYHSLQLIDKEGGTYFHVSDLRDASGEAEIVDTYEGDGTHTWFNLGVDAVDTNYSVKVDGTEVTSGITKTTTQFGFDTAPTDGAEIVATYNTSSEKAKAFTFGSRGTGNIGPLSTVVGIDAVASGYGSYAEGYRSVASGRFSHAEGMDSYAGGWNSHAEGKDTVAIATESHAEGNGTQATSFEAHAEGLGTHATGYCTHSEGRYTVASGHYSHAEGDGSKSQGESSHAEGDDTIASASASHAEGRETTANDTCSHAEGYKSVASYAYSHAQNIGTIAKGHAQTAIGRYNVEDTGNYLVQDRFVGDGDTRRYVLSRYTRGYATGKIDGVQVETTVSYGDAAVTVTLARTPNVGSEVVISYYAHDTYALIIGNGTADDTRSNALAVRWNGLIDQAGETAYPTFIRSSWSTSSDQTTLPVTPCFVLDTTAQTLYWCDGTSISQLGYLPLSGGTMTGPLYFKDGTALPSAGNNDFVVAGIHSFSNGGQACYKSLADMKSFLGLGAMAYKASLEASDIPNLNASKITSGILGVARGGTGISNSGHYTGSTSGTNISLTATTWTSTSSSVSIPAGTSGIIIGRVVFTGNSSNAGTFRQLVTTSTPASDISADANSLPYDLTPFWSGSGSHYFTSWVISVVNNTGTAASTRTQYVYSSQAVTVRNHQLYWIPIGRSF